MLLSSAIACPRATNLRMSSDRLWSSRPVIDDESGQRLVGQSPRLIWVTHRKPDPGAWLPVLSCEPIGAGQLKSSREVCDGEHLSEVFGLHPKPAGMHERLGQTEDVKAAHGDVDERPLSLHASSISSLEVTNSRLKLGVRRRSIVVHGWLTSDRWRREGKVGWWTSEGAQPSARACRAHPPLLPRMCFPSSSSSSSSPRGH